jgi:DNA-binding CsgD family transcriptional regulator/tetratricopeptide (TPR) repeat protein
MNHSVGGRLLERATELAALRGAVSAAAGGADAVVVVQGPAGIGKSALLAAARAEAAALGVRALVAAGSELDRDSPFALVSRLLGPVLASPAGEDGLLTGQAALAAPLFDGSLPLPGESDSLVRGLYWLVAALAARTHGLTLSVDDAQWADRASLRFLLSLVTGLDGLPVALVVAVRSGEPGSPRDLLDRLSAHASTRVICPRPLSQAAAARVLTDLFGTVDDAFARACAEASGGNPFLLRELALTLRDTGVPATAASVPEVTRTVPGSVSRAIPLRLSRLPGRARRLATAVAVLGDDAPLRTAAELAELSVEEAAVAADELAGATILAPGPSLRFLHPLLATAVHDDLPAFARARAHHRAAKLLMTAGAAAEAAAPHLLRADPAGEDQTVRVLQAAASSAMARGEPRSAVRILRRALAEPPAGEALVDVLLEAAAAEGQAHDRAAGATVSRALDLVSTADQRIRALGTQAGICYAGGDILGLLTSCEQALQLVNDTDPRAEQLLAQYLAAGSFHAPSRPRIERRWTQLAEQVRAGRPPRHPALLAHLALRSAFDAQPATVVRELAEQAVAADPLIDPAAHGLPLSLTVQALVSVDELVAADRLSAGGMAAARKRGDEVAYALAGFHRALPRYHRGDLAGALADLEPAVRRRDEGWAGGSGFLAHLLVQLHLIRGDLAAAGVAAGKGRLAAQDDLDRTMADYAFADLALADRKFAVAEEAAVRAGRQLREGFGIDHPGFAPWRCLAALAAHAQGEHDRARRFAEEALDRARWSGVARPLAHALRTAATVDDGPRALELLHEAAEEIAASPADLERAAILTELGAAARREGHRKDAQRTLLEAYRMAECMRAHALVRRARRELFALGLRPRRPAATGVDALTPNELRVAELVASGMNNREVAQALFVTPKTVEGHLTGAFRKLGATTREELAAHLLPETATAVVES